MFENVLLRQILLDDATLEWRRRESNLRKIRGASSASWTRRSAVMSS
jgi:hypothetical protein